MAKKNICRVCGKEYTPCRSLRNVEALFNWRKVACSPQCGEEYFRQVMEARGELPAEQEHTHTDAFDPDAEIESFFDP